MREMEQKMREMEERERMRDGENKNLLVRI
jgi:hypothetical protein